ncbi:hypothetical protein LLG46_12545 [bacterium]|nr:hypothetical protein [bacterium]
MKTILLVASVMIFGLSLSSYGAEEKPVHQKKNVILGLSKVDWSDVTKQNEFISCVISAMEHLGKKYTYDDLACVSGCAFRACCTSKQNINPSSYHVTSDIAIIPHTFKMLGYSFTLHKRSDYETDKKLIMDSIDKGIPVLTFHGVANWSECCIISGYDDDGAVLLGYSSFCDYTNGARDSEYFRFCDWHDGWFEQGNGKILIIGEPTKLPCKEEITKESLKIAVKLIRGTASESKDWVTGYAGHTRYAELLCKDTDDWDMHYTAIATNLGTLYRDKLYVAPFLREAKAVLKDKDDTLEQCAKLYDQISDLVREMLKLIPDDLSLGKGVLDKELRKQYAQRVYKIRDLEKQAADLLEKI